MALHKSEQFWYDYLRQKDMRDSAMSHQRVLLHEQAAYLKKTIEQEITDINKALTHCDEDTEKWIRSIVDLRVVHRMLHSKILESQEHAKNTGEEEFALFKAALEKGSIFRLEIEDISLNNSSEFDYEKAYSKDWTKLYDEAKENLQKPLEENVLRSWKDMPAEDLADRLSKGEIITANDWIPGISKGKKPLTGVPLDEHLKLGEKMRKSGIEAFKQGDFEMALIRFTQGIELLSWITSEDQNERYRIECLYSLHLRNCALSAVKCETYQEAIKAANTALEIDDTDSKARFYRGRANMFLGKLMEAKDDFIKITKCLYSSETSKSAARAALAELKKIKETNIRVLKQTFGGEQLSDSEDLEEEQEEDTSCTSSLHKKIAALSGINTREEAIEDEEMLDPFPVTERQTSKSSGFDKKTRVVESLVEKDALVEILEDFLDAYTQPEVQSKLDEIRHLSDYDERRFTIRLRSYIPSIQNPVFERHGFNSLDYKQNMKKLDRSVAHFKRENQQISELAQSCWNALYDNLGDL